MAVKLSPSRLRFFQKTIYAHYRSHGRDLPWRRSVTPYRVLVSEIMLQQTQVERVKAYYEKFLRTFPDISSLAAAPLRDVLAVWSGLGYNRRALALKRAAERITQEFGGRVPSDAEVLATLPGIGRATASAIRAFAFNKPVVFVETNIRTVFIHFFFRSRKTVSDNEILALVEQALDAKNPCEWYYALMDYGAMIKKTAGNAGQRSAHYAKQLKFEGSNRQLRGAVLKAVTGSRAMTEREIAKKVGEDAEKVRAVLCQLEKEGFITQRQRRVSVA